MNNQDNNQNNDQSDATQPQGTSSTIQPSDDPKDQPQSVARDIHYTPTLSPNPDETMSEDNEQIGEEHDSDGDVVKDNIVADQGKGSSVPGTPGHPGIDEDTG